MEETKNAVQRANVTAKALLFVTLMVNLWVHYDPALLDRIFKNYYWWDYKWHSHTYTTWTSMFVALFKHSDWEHVLGNMCGLWLAGRRVFINTPAWTSPWAFLWVYLGSQISSVAGCRLLSYWLNLEWQRTLVKGRVGWWTCVPIPWRDAWSTLFNVSQVAQLRVWQFAPIIGASAAVFGVVGAHVYTLVCSKSHPASMGDALSLIFWMTTIAMEFDLTPFSLDQVSLLFEDNIDHASHVCGFVGGFLLAAMWEYWHRPKTTLEHATIICSQ
jgi:membrane associated rhomboid family serine protease